MLTWLRENRHGPYWDHGSVRLGGTTSGYERIRVPTMIVAGWADGYRNNSFRTIAELARHGTPHRLLAGPWAHADPTTAMPGPRIDFDAELAGWFDRWLRGIGDHEDRCDVFVRSSTRPEIDLDLHEGRWLTLPSVPPVTEATLDLTAPVTLRVIPDVGTAAWIDCAGHLPWGLSGDQRLDDERSLTWEIEPPPSPVVGHPVFRARLWATEPQASISVKLCDVFPDGTSALVSRGSLDLAYRDGVHGSPSPLVPGHEVQVEVVLDACAYEWTPGNTLRVSVAGADWPNTIAPPAPLEMTLRTASLTLPMLERLVPLPGVRPGRRALLGVGRGRRLGDPPRRAHPDDVGDDPFGQPLPHAVRRDGARALPRRGLGRHPHLRAGRPGQHGLRPQLAGHRGRRCARA